MTATPARSFVLLVTVALIATACAATRAAPGWTIGPATTAGAAAAVPSASAPAASAPAAPASASAAPAGAVGGTLDFTAVDLAFEPQMVMVPGAGTYTVNLTNKGSIGHDMTFDDGTKITADPGATATAAVQIPAGGLNFICSVPGHAEAGMTGMVMVDEAGAGATAAPGSPAPSTTPGADSHGGPPPAVAGVDPDPNAAPYKPYDAVAPPLLAGTVHDIDLAMTEGSMTVAPGYVVDAWTFGGTVPGPVIRVKVGDTVRVHLKNPATNTHGPFGRLPRQPGRLERRDDLDQARARRSSTN